MDIANLKMKVAETLSKDRFSHTMRVMEEAIILAERFDVSTEDAIVAALLHDYAKCLPVVSLKKYVKQYGLPNELLSYFHELWHGPVGAEMAREQFNVSTDVYNAIYYHTTARDQMSKLELVIFVADYIEPARSFREVIEVRELAKVDLTKAAQKAIQNTIIYLLKNGVTVYPDSFLAYNALTNNIRSVK